jgi:biotin carboxyl carrier protein
MKTQIVAGGRTRTVEVRLRQGYGEKFLVSLDGRPHEVSVTHVNGVLSLLVGDRSYEVFVGKGVVHVDGTPVEVELARPTWARRGEAAHDQSGPQRVAAPMPGKIVKVLVKAGDRVEPRQGLVVVEAMKMENELRSRAAGTVTEVRAIEGSSVEAGAILIVVE